MRPILLSLLALAIGPAASQSPTQPGLPQAIPSEIQPLTGTLFFSREQRDRLDRARKRGEVVEEGEAIARETPPTMTGFLRSSDGKTVVWVDGKPYADGKPALVQRVGSTDLLEGRADRLKILAPVEGAAAAEKPAKKVRRPVKAPAPKAAAPVK